MAIRKDLTGQRFGRWIALNFVGKNKSAHTIWSCQCDCGNIKDVLATNLTRGLSISCGCFSRETTSKVKTTHGMTETKLYKKWEGMKRRCLYETGSRNGYYKAIGVTIWDEWMNSFEIFRDWALQNGYSDELSLDRIDNDSGYTPFNCRWVDRIQQMNNKTNNVWIEYNGVTHSAAEWSRITGIDGNTIRYRMSRNWPIIDVLFTPKHSNDVENLNG